MYKDSPQVIIFFIIICIIQYLILTIVVFYLVHQAQKRQKKHLEHIEELKLIQQNEILKARLEMQDETFKAISRELHDHISQRLSFIKLNLSTITRRTQLLNERLKFATNILAEAMNNMRNLSKTLNPDHVMGIGLLSAIRKEVEILNKSSILKVIKLELPEATDGISPQTGLMIYRIVQEAVNNIIKHAEAKELLIRLKKMEEYYELFIVDDGKGFEMETLKHDGLGLRNIRERATIIGASCKIISNPGMGTKLKIKIPVYEN